MRQFVESMRRLYQNDKVDKRKIESLFLNGKLTEEERKYILES